MLEHRDGPLDLAEIQAALRLMLADVLGVEPAELDADTPLQDMVTSSLLFVESLRRVYDRFGVLVSIRRILETQATLGALALHVEQALESQRLGHQTNGYGTGSSTFGDDARSQGELLVLPLTASEQHLAFLARYSAGASAAYNETVAVRLIGLLNRPALEEAVRGVSLGYDALRTDLGRDIDALEIAPHEPAELEVEPCATGGVEQRLAEIAGRPFEPGERLFRARLLQLSDTDHVLILVSHGLVLDDRALMLVLEDMGELYRAAVMADERLRDQPLTSRGTVLQSPRGVDRNDASRSLAEAYWRELFADGPPRLDLPTDRPRPPVKGYGGARFDLEVPADLDGELRAFAVTHGSTPQAVLLGAYAILMHRLARQEAIVIGIRTDRIDRDSRQRIVATNHEMLPVLSHFSPDRTFLEQVRALDEWREAASAHRQVSLSELIQLLNLPRDQSRSPFFTVAFRGDESSASNATGVVPSLFDPVATSRLRVPSVGARYDLELQFECTASDSSIGCEYSTELFNPSTIARQLQGLIELVRAGIARPNDSCGLLPIMPPTERAQILTEWNATSQPYPRDRTVLDLITEQADLRATLPAIRSGERTVTYGQLIERLERVAALLHLSGVGPGDRVGVLLERTPDLVAAMLAAWRVGAMYVPLDPSFPGSRLAYMVQDAGMKALITSPRLLPIARSLPCASLLSLDEPGDEATMTADHLTAASASSSAYIMYTSGSTGQPKGVEVGQSGLTNFVLDVQRLLRFTSADSFLAVTTASFDISLIELLLPLVSGGILELGEDGLAADGIRLAERIEALHPACVQLTASTWKAVLQAGWRGDPDIRIISAGESLSRELAEQLLPRCRVLWNLYGPTETTIFSACYQVTSAPGEPMRIGRPLANTRLYVLDDLQQLVPIGAVGELYIGGDGLARGYWQRPELTAERFISSPFQPGERLYRTGDLARFMTNGEVICLERLDDQVKIHGVRIELGEIEAILRSLPGVQDAVVVAWTNAQGERQLGAHLLANGADAPTAAEVAAQLRHRLPEVMIPRHFRFVDAFPISANGKIQRSALPAPVQSESLVRMPTVLPETPTERLLADAWARVLGITVEQIGRDDDFMDLGGHSLLMTPLMLEVRTLFQVRFSMRELFGASTLRKLSALIYERRLAGASGSAGLELTGGSLRGSEWGKQRMAFLQREGQLPANIAPARGLTYRPRAEIRSAFLTGATGFLGGHIIANALRTTDVELYCLVRPRHGQDSKARIEQNLRAYALWRDDEVGHDAWNRRVHVVEGDVTLPRLGLPGATYDELARDVDCIIHSAAHVNFLYPYEALRAANVLGVHEVIRFAFHRRITPVHYLSTAAIWPMGAEHTFYERDSIEHGELLNLGYDEAKWVGERALLHAAERGLPVSRYRPGEVGGDSESGRCVLDHLVIAMVKGFLQFGAFPSIDMNLDVAPADYVAGALVYLALRQGVVGKAFHLTNPRRIHMSDALEFLRGLGYQFDVRPFEQIRDEMMYRSDFASNALFPYQAMLVEMDDRSLEFPTYDVQETLAALDGSGIRCPALDGKLLGAYMGYLLSTNTMPAPQSRPSYAAARALMASP